MTFKYELKKMDMDNLNIAASIVMSPYLLFMAFLHHNPLYLLSSIFFLVFGVISSYNKGLFSKRIYKPILLSIVLVGVFLLIYTFINLPSSQEIIIRTIILFVLSIAALLSLPLIIFIVNMRKISRFKRGFELLYEIKYEEALDYFNKSTEFYPNNPVIWSGKALSLLNLNRYEQALKCSNKALDIKLGFSKFLVKNIINSILFNAQGLILIYAKDYNGALEYFDQSLKLRPNFVDWSNKGYVLSELENFEESMKCHNKALNINPKFEGALSNKGDTLRKLGKYEEANEYLDKALKINSKVPSIWLTKGKIIRDIGRHNEAIRYVEKALKLDPYFKDAEEVRDELLIIINK